MLLVHLVKQLYVTLSPKYFVEQEKMSIRLNEIITVNGDSLLPFFRYGVVDIVLVHGERHFFLQCGHLFVLIIPTF